MLHVLVPECTVEKAAGEVGAHLPDRAVIERLCEDTTYNIQTVIKTARTLQRAEGSTELTEDHISYAVELLGLPNSTPAPTTSHPPVPISGTPEPLFLSPTTEIDLYDFINKPDDLDLKPLPPITLEISITSEVPSGPAETLSPAAYRYLTQLTKQITFQVREEREEALAELRTGARVTVVAAHLLQFVDTRLRDNITHSGNTVTLLLVYKNLLLNERVFLEPYVHNLLNECYTMCCDWTGSRECTQDTHQVIEHSSDVAAFIILKYNEASNSFYDKYTRYVSGVREVNRVVFKSLHISHLNNLVHFYNTNYEQFQCGTPTPPVTPTSNPEGLLTYTQVVDKLGELATTVGPTWPALEGNRPPQLLSQKLTKDVAKKLRAAIVSYKGKPLPEERMTHLKKQKDKQIRANQIYNLYNGLTQLEYFL
eukprot:sb/3464977/